MARSFENKTAIVTGGASGLGESYVRAFAEKGARVALVDVQKEAGAALADELRASGHKALFVAADVSSETDTAKMAEAVMTEFGSIDVLVNNAALYKSLEAKRPFDEISLDEWDRMMQVNVRGVWLCCKSVVAHMREAGRGKIINMASAAVHAGVPYYAHYSASKGAIIALTRAIARELGSHNINVNAVAPGLVDNPASRKLNPGAYMERATAGRALARHMKDHDLVGTILFLASDDSDFITGQTFVVDGGSVMQ
jgi:NAD(P)-dependent dehydrogenase (short-subunit alcohol dehydrogenase family)